MDRFSVLRAAEETPHGIALIDDEGELDYRGLAREVYRYLPDLSELPAEAVVSLTPRLDRLSVVKVCAAIEAGVTLALFHPRWSSREVRVAVEQVRPALALESLAPSNGLCGPRAIDVNRELGLIFTSGTTGTPRAARLSRRALLAAAVASAERLGWTDDDRWLLAMPLAHVGGLSIVLRCLHARRPIVLHEGPIEAGALIGTVTRHAATLASLVPTMLGRWLELEGDPTHLRALLLGGAACPAPLLQRGIARGLPLRPTYGLTEMCAQVATLPFDARSGGDGVGPPLPLVELDLRDERIFVRGPSLFDGFVAKPPPFDALGFYDTGDHGRLDAHGHLHLFGRRSDLIVSGGENVYPAEVEGVLEGIPGIASACVFGLLDPTWGHLVCAACVSADPPAESEIRRALDENLAGFKHPRRLAWVESLVIAPSGKLDRRATAALATPNLRGFSRRS